MRAEAVWGEFVVKGQISLEFLLILAISVSFLLALVGVYLNLKKNIEIFLEESFLKNFLILLEKNISEVCMMGEGNEREFNFYLMKEIEIKSYENKINIENFSIYSNCYFEEKSERVKSGRFKIRKEGKILWYTD
ncbi:MAG: hypothetical protein QXI58_02285 [Candidatus Micrarchaeia archaeon]